MGNIYSSQGQGNPGDTSAAYEGHPGQEVRGHKGSGPVWRVTATLEMGVGKEHLTPLPSDPGRGGTHTDKPSSRAQGNAGQKSADRTSKRRGRTELSATQAPTGGLSEGPKRRHCCFSKDQPAGLTSGLGFPAPLKAEESFDEPPFHEYFDIFRIHLTDWGEDWCLPTGTVQDAPQLAPKITRRKDGGGTPP